MSGEHGTTTDGSKQESQLRARVERYFVANPDATVIDALGELALSPDHQELVKAVQADSDDGDSDEPASSSVSETRVVHRSEPHDVYIGRGRGGDGHLNNTEIGETGWLGNPYKLDGQDGGYSRKQSLALYCGDLLHRIDQAPKFTRALAELQGQRLACYCRRAHESEPACHGDVLAEAIEGLKPAAGSGESAGSDDSVAYTSGDASDSVPATDAGRENGRETGQR